LVGRLAVDQRFRGRGLGGALIADAALRVINSEVRAFALTVDAIDDRAAAFYDHHGFRRLVSQPRSLFLPWQ
jgi:ribosomal protein S18 acetylase RimI-like enzyme